MITADFDKCSSIEALNPAQITKKKQRKCQPFHSVKAETREAGQHATQMRHGGGQLDMRGRIANVRTDVQNVLCTISTVKPAR